MDLDLVEETVRQGCRRARRAVAGKPQCRRVVDRHFHEDRAGYRGAPFVAVDKQGHRRVIGTVSCRYMVPRVGGERRQSRIAGQHHIATDLDEVAGVVQDRDKRHTSFDTDRDDRLTAMAPTKDKTVGIRNQTDPGIESPVSIETAEAPLLRQQNTGIRSPRRNLAQVEAAWRNDALPEGVKRVAQDIDRERQVNDLCAVEQAVIVGVGVARICPEVLLETVVEAVTVAVEQVVGNAGGVGNDQKRVGTGEEFVKIVEAVTVGIIEPAAAEVAEEL